MSRQIKRDDWKGLYPPADEAFAGEMARLMDELPRDQEALQRKRKLPAGMMLAFVLVLLAVGGVAAVQQWGVMDFLFATAHAPAEPFVQAVSGETANAQVQVRVDSALCDGQYLAFDWTVTPLVPEQTIMVRVENFTGNGERLWTDGTDDFDGCWLNASDENGGVMQDGDMVALPASLHGAETLDVVLTMGVYTATAPVYVMPQDDSYPRGFDPAVALEKIRQGCVVIFSYDEWVVEDAEDPDGVASIVRFTPGANDPFARTELTLRFTVDVAACAAETKTLVTEPTYVEDRFTAHYDRAMVTPLGLYLDLTLTPAAGFSEEEAFKDISVVDGQIVLTDGGGAVLDSVWPSGESYGEAGTMQCHYVWFGLGTDNLPETISLSYLSDDGSTRYIFPARLGVSTGGTAD